MALAAAAATVVANSGKIATVANAVAGLDAQGWTWFGLAAEGGGRRNEMTICNALDHNIELARYYIHWGKVKVPPEPMLQAKTEDHALFHNTGSWAATGSSGIVTYKLKHDTYLHYMWDCPFNFDYSDNFIGLMLTSDSKLKRPRQELYKNMYMYTDWTELNLGKPKENSNFDLVCCGPSHGDSHEEDGEGPWGLRRPCKVSNDHYEVLATMGDRHATSSKVILCHRTETQTDNVSKNKPIPPKASVELKSSSQFIIKQTEFDPKPQCPNPELPLAKTATPSETTKPTANVAPTFNNQVVCKAEKLDCKNDRPVKTGCFCCFRLKSLRHRR